MVTAPAKYSSSDKLPASPDSQPRTALWQRLMLACVLLAAGSAVMVVGGSSIFYRLTHMTVDGGLVNGRVMRLQAPIDGKLKAFYGQSGAPVRSGQVIARITPTPQHTQNLLSMQGEVQVTTAQLTSAYQSFAFLQQQLTLLEDQDQALQQANVAISDKEVSYQQAAVDAAIANANAARLDYDRYRTLAAEGAISQQKVDQVHALWQSAEAEVKQARANLLSANTSLNAFQDGISLKPGATLANQRLNLTQAIQNQRTQIKTLEAQLATQQKRLAETQSLYSKQKEVEVVAPFNGVIYRTERESGELVNRPNDLLTLLDCNDLWIESLVTAEQARRIDAQAPVRVKLAGDPKTFVGKVELLEGVTSIDMIRKQVQALLPPVPDWVGSAPLARVTVRIPPPSQQAYSQQLCGVGQSASLTFGIKVFPQ